MTVSGPVDPSVFTELDPVDVTEFRQWLHSLPQNFSPEPNPVDRSDHKYRDLDTFCGEKAQVEATHTALSGVFGRAGPSQLGGQ